MSLREDLISRFPDLDVSLIDKYLPIYKNRYKVYYNAEYGANKEDDEIILNLLAHLITVSSNFKNGENIKQISSESVNGVSVSYATQQSNIDDNFFNSTIYGQMFKVLIKKNNGAFFIWKRMI